MILVFVVDTGSAMGEKMGDGPGGGNFTLLDLAKNAVDCVAKGWKWGKNDQFLLLTTEPGAGAVRVKWGEGPAHFEMQLKTLRPACENSDRSSQSTPTNLGSAIRSAFFLMNKHRFSTGVDNWGRGRSPVQLEAGACIVLTACAPNDKIVRVSDLDVDLQGRAGEPLAVPPPVGEELCQHIYRWDQRLYSLVFGKTDARLASPQGKALTEVSERTGGITRYCQGMSGVVQCVGVLLQRMQPQGPIIQLQPMPDKEEESAMDTSEIEPDRAVLVPRGGGGIWPIPEATNDIKSEDLPPPRSAHPELLFSRAEVSDPVTALSDVAERLNITGDSYDVEWCQGSGTPTLVPPLIVPRNAKWPVLLQAPQSTGAELPFGYLKASPLNTTKTMLVLLPYNYPRLIQLLLQIEHHLGPNPSPNPNTPGSTATPVVMTTLNSNVVGGSASILTKLDGAWRAEFAKYYNSVPPYYYAALKRCLATHGLQSLVNEKPDGGLGRKGQLRLKRLRETAKIEADQAQQALNVPQSHFIPPNTLPGGAQGEKSAARSLSLVPHGQLLEHFESIRRALYGGGSGLTITGLFNEYSAPGKHALGDKVTKSGKLSGTTQNNLSGLGISASLLASVGQSKLPNRTIAVMSNYMTVLLAKDPLRDPELLEPDPEEDTPAGLLRRKIAVDFGNPFKASKKGVGTVGASGDKLKPGSPLAGIGLPDEMDEVAEEASVLKPSFHTTFDSETLPLGGETVNPDVNISMLTGTFAPSSPLHSPPPSPAGSTERSPPGSPPRVQIPSTSTSSSASGSSLLLQAQGFNKACETSAELSAKRKLIQLPTNTKRAKKSGNNNNMNVASPTLSGIPPTSTSSTTPGAASVRNSPPLGAVSTPSAPSDQQSLLPPLQLTPPVIPTAESTSSGGINSPFAAPTATSTSSSLATSPSPFQPITEKAPTIIPPVPTVDKPGSISSPFSAPTPTSTSSSGGFSPRENTVSTPSGGIKTPFLAPTAASASSVPPMSQTGPLSGIKTPFAAPAAAPTATSGSMSGATSGSTSSTSAPPPGPEDYILPEGWIVSWSKREKRHYFFNTVTNKSEWVPPKGSRLRPK